MHHFFHPPFFFALHVIGVLILLSIVARVVGRRGCAAVCGGRGSRAASSSEPVNREFDVYRQTTLKRLELEAEEFRKYLDGLRVAADKAAFDAFLTSRRGGSVT
jgi:hypothetical protein